MLPWELLCNLFENFTYYAQTEFAEISPTPIFQHELIITYLHLNIKGFFFYENKFIL